MLKLFLWLRYLRKRKIVLLSIVAVALSCGLLIVVNSLFAGFIENVKNADLWDEGDIQLITQMIPQYDILIDEIEKIEEVECAGPILAGGGLLYMGKGDVREVHIIGADPGRLSKGSDFRGSLLRQKDRNALLSFDVPGYPNEIGGWVGIGAVAEPNEQTDEYDLREINSLIGKQVVLITPGRVRSKSSQPGETAKWELKRKMFKFRISDILHSGVFFRDKALYLPYAESYRLFFGDTGPAQASYIRIDVQKGGELTSVKDKVLKVWQGFASEQLGLESNTVSRVAVSTRQEVYQPALAEFSKQMGVLMLIFGVISSVAVLLIFCIFYMIVTTRLKDIAIIKSCGTTSSAVALIFVGFGACVGIAGAALGIMLGAIVTKNINVLEQWVRIIFGIKLWRSSVYMFEQIPNEVNWQAVWPIALIAIAGCCLGAFVPAIVAARTRPVKILRYE